MKTFREFLEEAHLYEMRKEDKVKGKKKTPLNIEREREVTIPGSAKKTPEGKWKVTPRKTKTVKDTTVNPVAQMARYRQGMGHNAAYSSTGGAGYGYARHPHGGGGSGAEAPGKARGVKRTATIQQRRERPAGERTPAQKVADKRAKAKTLGYSL